LSLNQENNGTVNRLDGALVN